MSDGSNDWLDYVQGDYQRRVRNPADGTLLEIPSGGVPHEDSVVTDNLALTSQHTDLAVAELRYQTAYYLEAIQAMMDGVTLGAEQVQDKRTELLEVGPTTTTKPGLLVIAIVMTLILEGIIGSAIAAFATRTFLKPIMRSIGKAFIAQNRREAGALAGKMHLFRQEAAEARSWLKDSATKSTLIKNYVKACEKAADVLEMDMRGKLKQARPVYDALKGIMAFTEKNLVAKAPEAAVKSIIRSPEPVFPGTSPGVEIAASAIASASLMRLTLVAMHEALEAEIKRPNITIKEVMKILSEYSLDNQIELEQIRDSYRLGTEAMIWSILLVDNVTKNIMDYRRKLPTPKTIKYGFIYSEANHLPMKLHADPKITKYLIVRFANEVERWARETDAWTGTNRGFQSPTWGPGQPEQEKEDLLVAYLAAVAASTPETDFQLVMPTSLRALPKDRTP